MRMAFAHSLLVDGKKGVCFALLIGHVPMCRAEMMLMHSTLARGDDTRGLTLADLFGYHAQSKGPSAFVLCFITQEGENAKPKFLLVPSRCCASSVVIYCPSSQVIVS